MLTNTLAQTNKFLDMAWSNWENGFEKVSKSQQEYNKIFFQTMKKQQEMFSTATANLYKAEEELKSTINEMTQSLKKNGKSAENEEVTRQLENLNEKVNDIMNRTQSIAATPSKATLKLLEQSGERIYELAEELSDEQNKWQIQTKKDMDKYMTLFKESQKKLTEIMEEQMKLVSETVQTK